MTPACPLSSTDRIAARADCDLRVEHTIDLALCGELERLADDLPALSEDGALRRLSERLLAASERWSDPRWKEAFRDSMAWDARLIDSIHAEDVSEAIWRHWRNPGPASTGQLSYMLRALFDGRRRAVALEAALLGCGSCQSSAID